MKRWARGDSKPSRNGVAVFLWGYLTLKYQIFENGSLMVRFLRVQVG